MAVCRIEKTKDYTVMSNHHLRNEKLSLKAKGLLSLMLSLPEKWDYTIKGLSQICKDGVDSINATIKELEKAGYISRERLRNKKGQLAEVEYTIRESPLLLKCGEPVLEKPILDIPTLGKHDQLNTKKSNKDLLSTYQSNHITSGDYERVPFERMDGNDYENLKERVLRNIEYRHFMEHGSLTIRSRLTEVADLIIETICSTTPTINIAGQDYPAQLVKDKMLRINSMHIEYVFECLDDNPSDIKNIKRYLLATLFNAPSTMDNYYMNKIQSDM